MPASDSTTRGHLFIINGDLTTLKCDAVLVPTDSRLKVRDYFSDLVAAPHLASQVAALTASSWAGRKVIRLETDSTEPRTWLGKVGGTSQTPVKWFVDVATEYVAQAATELRQERTDGLPPTISLPVVGTGGGGGAERRGEVLNALIPELMKLAVEHNVDIVLVAHGQVTYDAAQAVRRDHIAALSEEEGSWVDPWAELGPERIAAAETVVRQARSGNLVVFVGAGVSTGAGLPAWQALLTKVAARLKMSGAQIARMRELDVRDQAALLSRKRGFDQAVSAELSAGRYSLTHGLLTSLPVNEFVTTNFDELLEAAARTPGGNLSVVPGQPIRSGSRILVKLHGTLGEDLVLTRSQYRDVKTRHGALFGLLQAMLMTRHMLFVGYSMRDEDFNDVMHDVRAVYQASSKQAVREQKKLGTVLSDFDNPQFAALWRDLDVVPALGRRRTSEGRVVEATEAEWAKMTRNQALFLDRVGMHSASGVRFVTSKSFAGVGGKAARNLADAIGALREAYDNHGDSEKGPWHELRALLDKFSSDD
jgi:hypothetical protein